MIIFFKKENFVCLQDRVINIVAGVVTGVSVAVSTAVMLFANVVNLKSAWKHSVSGWHDCFRLDITVYYMAHQASVTIETSSHLWHRCDPTVGAYTQMDEYIKVILKQEPRCQTANQLKAKLKPEPDIMFMAVLLLVIVGVSRPWHETASLIYGDIIFTMTVIVKQIFLRMLEVCFETVLL